MSDPRIVTSEEAQASLPDASTMGLFEWRLAHTVATEPERIRAAIVKALEVERRRLITEAHYDSAARVKARMVAIEDGADL